MYSKALQHFQKVDPVLYTISSQINLPEIIPADSTKYFEQLVDSIVSQQLSIKAAATIWNRVLDIFPDRVISPEIVIETPEEVFRKAGMSFAKIKYIKDLATRNIDFSTFRSMNDEQIAQKLVEVKGIGPWTAEMFLIFTMGRPDVFSYGDLGLRNAIKKLSGLKLPETWSPYRSYASRVLWKSLEQ